MKEEIKEMENIKDNTDIKDNKVYKKVVFKNKEYLININKLKALLYHLTNSKIDSEIDSKIDIKEDNIKDILKEYKLMDEYFLENINDI